MTFTRTDDCLGCMGLGNHQEPCPLATTLEVETEPCVHVEVRGDLRGMGFYDYLHAEVGFRVGAFGGTQAPWRYLAMHTAEDAAKIRAFVGRSTVPTHEVYSREEGPAHD